MRSQSVTLSLLITVLLVLAACTAEAGPVPSVPSTPEPPPAGQARASAIVTAPEPPAPALAAAYPLQVTDDLGRKVTVAARPERIVSLAPAITEILFATGAGGRVVGVTEYCNYPPEAQQGPQVVGGFSAKSLSVEKIVSLRPDVVFSAGAIHQPVIEALEQTGLLVVALEPQGFEGIYRNIVLTGQVVGQQAAAGALVAAMQARVAAVTEAVASVPAEQRLKVFYEVWDEPLMTAGPTTFIGQMIELAGGQNIFAEVQEAYPQISAEMVIERDPDLILGPDTHAEGLTAEKIRSRPGWQDIRAVQEGHIRVLNGDIVSRAGPRVVDGLEMIAHLLYPDLFE